MNVIIKKGKAQGSVVAPPSKSYAHRELICAALSMGGEVKNLSFSDDINATLSCLEALGFRFVRQKKSVVFLGRNKPSKEPLLDCNASGSTLRFIIPVALSLVDSFTVTGVPRLMERGVDIYKNICELQGIEMIVSENSVHFKGRIHPGDFVIPGNVSSQYITGLLLALPLLDGESKVSVLPPFESSDYVGITLDVLSKFGVDISQKGLEYLVNGPVTYRQQTVEVEGDYSNAAFLLVWNYLGGNVEVSGLTADSRQGDRVCLDCFERLAKGKATIDISNCIDLGPVLMAFAALRFGATLTGSRRLKIKESDRGNAMKEELEKAGARIEVKDDQIEVFPISSSQGPYVFDAHGDHRIAMALSLLSSVNDIELKGAECVNKSFPEYFGVLEKLGMEVTYER